MLDLWKHLKESCCCFKDGKGELTVMNSFICFFSMRLESSRCSAALRLSVLGSLVLINTTHLPVHWSEDVGI
jgi:hypothetical protein